MNCWNLAFYIMEHICWIICSVSNKCPLMMILVSGCEVICPIQLLQSEYSRSAVSFLHFVAFRYISVHKLVKITV